MTILSTILLIAGFTFLIVSAIGAIRLPDFYTRCHAIGVVDTLGLLLAISGLILSHGLSIVSFKLIILLLFIYLANPTITHVFTRAALKSDIKPWKRDGND